MRGVLTDGDIRRALLAGDTLDSPLRPHVKDQFISVGPDASRAEVLDIMQGRARSNESRCRWRGAAWWVFICCITFWAPSTARNWAVIMAGGQGTRLRPLTNDI